MSFHFVFFSSLSDLAPALFVCAELHASSLFSRLEPPNFFSTDSIERTYRSLRASFRLSLKHRSPSSYRSGSLIFSALSYNFHILFGER
ncbi:hypothetical protein FPV67DRAFT_869895 [Lyophyllum atratum]|nr:hypothetical protein FPV67DRAFT_869895 [Lyophyllum atratum]